MKKPTDDEVKLWENLFADVNRIKHNTHQEPLKYTKERPKIDPGQFYPKPTLKATYNVTSVDYRDIKHQMIDARIDLHGDTLDHASARLVNFFTNAQRRGDKLALVITGKGKMIDGERVGVLRNEIPRWFESNAQFVISFTTAQPHDGGEGAFYVRIRKLRGL